MRLLPAAALALLLAACQAPDEPAPVAIPDPTPQPEPPAALGQPDPLAPPVESEEDAATDVGTVAPHGGLLRPAGGGYLEFVVNGDDLFVFVLDGARAALPVADIRGAELRLPQGAVPLRPEGDHLVAPRPTGETVSAEAHVPVGGDVRVARVVIGPNGIVAE